MGEVPDEVLLGALALGERKDAGGDLSCPLGHLDASLRSEHVPVDTAKEAGAPVDPALGQSDMVRVRWRGSALLRCGTRHLTTVNHR